MAITASGRATLAARPVKFDIVATPTAWIVFRAMVMFKPFGFVSVALVASGPNHNRAPIRLPDRLMKD
jgi:hypothetical protein